VNDGQLGLGVLHGVGDYNSLEYLVEQEQVQSPVFAAKLARPWRRGASTLTSIMNESRHTQHDINLTEPPFSNARAQTTLQRSSASALCESCTLGWKKYRLQVYIARPICHIWYLVSSSACQLISSRLLSRLPILVNDSFQNSLAHRSQCSPCVLEITHLRLE
jgi:hypothetical protein